jgi:homoserine kinase type II
MTVKHCGPVGEALAALHLAGRDFPLKRPNALSVSGWRPVFEGSRRHIDPPLDRELSAELDFFEANWPQALPAGVIHADLFNDNVFFLNERLSGLIDFYFACNDFLAYDVAICLNAWCFEPDNAFNATKARALLQGYDKVRRLGDDERRALPTLARGSALRFLLTRLYDWAHTPPDALVKRKDPNEYLAKLRFHRGVDRWRITACERTSRGRAVHRRRVQRQSRARAAGRRSCAWGRRSASCRAARRPRPTTRWS